MAPFEKGEFYKKDRKVLRFFCKYKDGRLQGDKRDYILYYYLLNDSIEISEVGAKKAAASRFAVGTAFSISHSLCCVARMFLADCVNILG